MSEVVLIASSFVRQYYTLLNKAPCFIHNFYSHDSTFIHGTIEMANEHHTEPVVGREKIKKKMEDLRLNDCRAKIKQIDCLETIGGGLVIQVIGELSNNGGPMRRFLQTFVLAPSHDEIRHEGQDSQQRSGVDSRRGVHINENNSNTSHNQKFFVLNSIFRYQDDGPDGDYEDEPASVQADASTDSAKQAPNDIEAKDVASPSNNVVTVVAPQSKQQQSGFQGETKPPAAKVVHNGISATPDRRAEVSDKSENKPVDTQPSSTTTASSQGAAPSSTSASQATPSASTVSVAPKPQPSNEPKTWANMVRNAHPPPQSSQATSSVTKPNSTDQSQPQNSSTHHNQPQHQSSSQQQTQSDQQAQQNPQNNNNGRRRNMIRKTSNKLSGSRLRNRPRPSR